MGGLFRCSLYPKPHIKEFSFFFYTCFPELVSVPYSNQILETNFSKTTRQKLKLNIYFYRVSLALSEYNFTINLSVE